MILVDFVFPQFHGGDVVSLRKDWSFRFFPWRFIRVGPGVYASRVVSGPGSRSWWAGVVRRTRV